MATITLRGTAIHTVGELPNKGSSAPDFVLVNSDLEDVSLATWAGKKKLLSIVPSLDTPVCATSTKKFNEKASTLDDSIFLIISGDLPFAMSRFCTAESAANVYPLSTMRSDDFAKQYGVLITDGPLAGLTARAVLVLDTENRIVYSELVPEIAQEPNYDAALAALSG